MVLSLSTQRSRGAEAFFFISYLGQKEVVLHMPFIKEFSLNLPYTNPFAFNVNSIKFADRIALSTPVTFFIGDNGNGKSTLIETLACWLQLPHMDGRNYMKDSFAAACTFAPFLDVTWGLNILY